MTYKYKWYNGEKQAIIPTADIHKVDCPKCGAKAGTDCVLVGGKPSSSWHNERNQAAREAYEARKKPIKEETSELSKKIKAHMEKIRKSLGAIDAHLEHGENNIKSIGTPNKLKEFFDDRDGGREDGPPKPPKGRHPIKKEDLNRLWATEPAHKVPHDSHEITYTNKYAIVHHPTKPDVYVRNGQRHFSEYEPGMRILTVKKAPKDLHEETFGSAFNTARKSGKETFSFGGKNFTTQKKGESSDTWKSSLKPAAPVDSVVPAPRLDRSRLNGSSTYRAPVSGIRVPKAPEPGGIRSGSTSVASSKPAASNPSVSASRSTSTVAPERSGISKPTRPVSGLDLPKTPTGISDTLTKPDKTAFDSNAKYAADTLASRIQRMNAIKKVDVVGNMGKPPKVSSDLQTALDAKAKSTANAIKNSGVKVAIKELSTALIDRYRRKGNDSLGPITAALFSHDRGKKAEAEHKETIRMKSLNIADAKLGKGGTAKIAGKD